MIIKNWLIRTKNKKILGPVSRDKVVELIEKGSLTDNDEITSGNGYWFWIKEKALLDKYLYGDLTQTFNPISEAADVLTGSSASEDLTSAMFTAYKQSEISLSEGNGPILPSQEDLKFPDIIENKDSADEKGLKDSKIKSDFSFEDSSATSEMELGDKLRPAKSIIENPEIAVDKEEDNFNYPSKDDLAFPGEEHSEALKDDSDASSINLNTSKKENTKQRSRSLRSKDSSSKKEKENKSGFLLPLILFTIIVVAIISVIYYYKVVLNKPIPFIGIREAKAQTIKSLSKKKVL